MIQEDYNEINVTLRIPKKYYKAGQAISYLLGFKSFDEYVSHAVMQNIFMEMDCAGSLNVLYADDIGSSKTLSDKRLKVEEGWLLQWQILIMRKKKERI